jgi:uncharacterized protein YukE
MNPKVMLRELRRQERQTVSYVRSLSKESELAYKRWNNVPEQLAGALSDAKVSLKQIRESIREWRAKIATPQINEEE